MKGQSAIRRGLLDTIDSRARLIAIKGRSWCGEDQFPTRLLQGFITRTILLVFT